MRTRHRSGRFREKGRAMMVARAFKTDHGSRATADERMAVS